MKDTSINSIVTALDLIRSKDKKKYEILMEYISEASDMLDCFNSGISDCELFPAENGEEDCKVLGEAKAAVDEVNGVLSEVVVACLKKDINDIIKSRYLYCPVCGKPFARSNMEVPENVVFSVKCPHCKNIIEVKKTVKKDSGNDA